MLIIKSEGQQRGVACKLVVAAVLWLSLWNRADNINNVEFLGRVNVCPCVCILITVLSLHICSASVVSCRDTGECLGFCGQLLRHCRVPQVVVSEELNQSFAVHLVSKYCILLVVKIWFMEQEKEPSVVKGSCMPRWKTIQALVIPRERITILRFYLPYMAKYAFGNFLIEYFILDEQGLFLVTLLSWESGKNWRKTIFILAFLVWDFA